MQAASRDQGARESCEDCHSFNLSLLPQSMNGDDEVHNHWFLVAQAEKNGVLQVVVFDKGACNRNYKPSDQPSLIPANYI